MHYSKILGLLLVISSFALGMEKEERKENQANQPQEYRLNLWFWDFVIRKKTDTERRNDAIGESGECQSLLSKGTKKSACGQ